MSPLGWRTLNSTPAAASTGQLPRVWMQKRRSSSGRCSSSAIRPRSAMEAGPRSSPTWPAWPRSSSVGWTPRLTVASRRPPPTPGILPPSAPRRRRWARPVQRRHNQPHRVLRIVRPSRVAQSYLDSVFVDAEYEPPRDSRRLHYLRGWSHEHSDEVFAGGARAGGSAGF